MRAPSDGMAAASGTCSSVGSLLALMTDASADEIIALSEPLISAVAATGQSADAFSVTCSTAEARTQNSSTCSPSEAASGTKLRLPTSEWTRAILPKRLFALFTALGSKRQTRMEFSLLAVAVECDKNSMLTAESKEHSNGAPADGRSRLRTDTHCSAPGLFEHHSLTSNPSWAAVISNSGAEEQ